MRRLLIICFITVGFTATAQTEDELKALATAQAELASEATVNADYKTLLDYTHPAVLALMGGRESAMDALKGVMRSFEDEGVYIEKSEIGKLVGFAYEQEEYRCVVENFMVMHVGEDSVIESTSYLFGMYSEADSKWYFIEGSELRNPETMKMVFPEMQTKLNIPKNTQRTLKK